MSQQQVGRRKELEGMFKRFPDIPAHVIVQDDLRRLGMDFTESALDTLEPFADKAYSLDLRDRVSPEKLGNLAHLKVPDQLHFTGGIYGLKGYLTFDVDINPGSEYVVDKIDEKLVLCSREGGQHFPIAEVGFLDKPPKFRQKKFEDGTLFSEVVDAVPHNNFVRIVPMRMCQYWGYGLQCKFCSMNYAADQQLKMGRRSKRKWTENVAHVAEAVREIYQVEEWPVGGRPRSVFITGGTILEKVEGMTEDDFYLRYVEAIRAAVGNRWPVILQTRPLTREEALRYKEAGVTAHEANLEIWDENLFKILCPGKAKYMGWKQWVDKLIGEVDVFGEGNVSPCFVAGVELAQPWGFKTIDEALKSTLSGWEYLMSHGVIPRPLVWMIHAGSGLEKSPPTPLEYIVRADIGWYELWKKYGLPPILRFNLMGPGNIFSTRGWCSMGT